MRHEKIIKREDGTRYLLCIDLYIDSFRETVSWTVQVWTKAKGKRNWTDVPDTLYEHTIRRMSLKDQEEHRMKNILRFVTPEEILEAKLELWNKIKPV